MLSNYISCSMSDLVLHVWSRTFRASQVSFMGFVWFACEVAFLRLRRWSFKSYLLRVPKTIVLLSFACRERASHLC